MNDAILTSAKGFEFDKPFSKQFSITVILLVSVTLPLIAVYWFYWINFFGDMESPLSNEELNSAKQTGWIVHGAVTAVFILLTASLAIFWLQLRSSTSKLLDKKHPVEKLVDEIPGAFFQIHRHTDQSISLPYSSNGMKKLLCAQDLPVNHIRIRQLLRMIHDNDRKEVLSNALRCMNRLTAWQQEFRIINHSGNTVWVQISATPEKQPDGSVIIHGYLQDLTHEKEVSQVMKVQELKLNLALDAVQDGIWEYDHENNEIIWDNRIRNMLGYDNSFRVLNAKKIALITHPQDIKELKQRYEKISRLDGQITFTIRLRTAWQEWIWVQARGRVLEWDEQGRPVRSIGLMHNITDLVSNSQLRDALLNRSMACITLVSHDRKLIEANEKFKSMFLKENQSVDEFSFHSDIHLSEQHWEEFGRKYKTLRHQDLVRFEFPMRDRWGVIHWFDIQGVLKEPGNPESDVIWTLYDVSARHAADQALALERLRLRTLLQHFYGGVLMVDPHNTLVLINEIATQLLDLKIDAASLEGVKFTDLTKVTSETAYNWLQQARSFYLNNSKVRLEVETARRQFLEIEFLEICEGRNKLGSVWFIHDVTQRAKEAQILKELAETDSLTGLPNRRRFMQYLDQLNDITTYGGDTLGALVMLDIDHFKALNDKYGHIIGDAVLAHVSQIIRGSLRETESLPARLGGEEFSILLKNVDQNTAFRIVERIRLKIMQQPLVYDLQVIPITVSAGICMIEPGHIHQSIQKADMALYRAKFRGRNQTVFWHQDLKAS